MNKKIKTIKSWIIFFMVTLALSGITAIPAEGELKILCDYISTESALGQWLHRVYEAVMETNIKYPFIAYGYDWLAFAHIVLAILFFGPLRDPIKNKWVIEFGMIACVLIIPYAMITGYFRGIPIGWRLIDCSFGIIGLIPLKIVLNKINFLEQQTKVNYETV